MRGFAGCPAVARRSQAGIAPRTAAMFDNLLPVFADKGGTAMLEDVEKIITAYQQGEITPEEMHVQLGKLYLAHFESLGWKYAEE